MTLTKNAINNLTISKSIHLHRLGTYISGEQFYLFFKDVFRQQKQPVLLKLNLPYSPIIFLQVVSIKVVSCSIRSREMSSH